MSNKSRLQTNNENLQSLIDKANQLPDAGGGGGSVDTCDIRIFGGTAVTTEQTMRVIATTYENNAITTFDDTFNVYFYLEEGMGSTSVIQNVVNNTSLTLIFEGAAPATFNSWLGSVTPICVDGNMAVITFTEDAETNMCNIVLNN